MSAAVHDRRADGDDARPRVHERHLRVQRRRLVRPRLRLPARPAHARARSRLGRELDRDRRRPRRRSPSRPCRTPSGTAPSMLANSAYDFWAYAQNRRYNTFAFRGAQMDAYGNVNNTTIGPYESPKVRLPGRRRHGGPELHDPAHLPLVDDARPAHVRRAARLPLRDGLGRRRRPPRAARPRRAGPSCASRTSACSTSIPTRSGCRSAACTPASPPSRWSRRPGSRSRPRRRRPGHGRADRGGAPDPARRRRPDRRAAARVPMTAATGYPRTRGRRRGDRRDRGRRPCDPGARRPSRRRCRAAPRRRGILFDWVRDEIRLRHGARRRDA